MPSFKPKSNKKIKFNKKSAITLDTKHKEFLNEFNKDENDRIPELKLEKQEIKTKLKNEYNTLTIEQRLDLEDKINEINEKLKYFKSKKKEYYLDNSKFIFEYFENKKNISSNNNVQNITNKAKVLNSFFKIKENNTNNITSTNTFTQKDNNNIVQKYLSNIDDIFLDVNTFVCQTDI